MTATYGTATPGVESGVLGWDVGGVHTKAAMVRSGRVTATASRPYELQHAPEALPEMLRGISAEAGLREGDRHAVTMTAELSQAFRTKREGVAWVLDGFRSAFGDDAVHVADVDGTWRAPAEARAAWRTVAAANWSVTARLVGQRHADVLLVDIGSTTTDIIPIMAGRPATLGLDDPGRLASYELVYAGVVRTPVEALVSLVPYGTAIAGVSAEGFALTGDVHVWRGQLAPADYDTATPDGRPATREYCGERLARVICADLEMVDARHIELIAECVADVQLQRVIAALRRVLERHPTLRHAVCLGLGAWLGRDAATAVGLELVEPHPALGDAHLIAPAAAAALLLDGGR